MTDPVQLPPSLPGQTRSAATPEEESNAQIVSLPPGLDVRDLVKLRGEVLQVTADNVVRIMTEKGEVDIRLDPGEPVPQKGDVVEVEIRPGQPPTAKITAEEFATPPPRSAETPVEVTVRENEELPLPLPPSQALPEQPVRLEAVEPEEALALIAEPLDVIISTLDERTGLQTEIAAAQIRNEIEKQIVTLIKTPEKSASPPPVTQAIIQGQKPPLISLNVKTAPPDPVTLIKPQTIPANVPADPVTVKFTSVLLPEAPEEDPIALIQQAFQVRIDIAEVLKPETVPTLTTIPQSFYARISAVEIPPLQITDIPEKTAAKIKTVQSISQSEPVILKNLKAGTVTATVIAQTPQKLPVIAIFSPGEPLSFEKASFFIVHSPLPNLIPGMEVILAPHEDGQVVLTAPAMAAPTLFAPEPWPLMDEIYEALAQAMPQAAQAFSNTLPSPARPEQLGPAALFFLAAVRGGDLTQWLGDRAADVIRRAGRNGLLSRLSLEGASLNRLSSEPVSQDWRGISLPLFWDNEIHKLALYFRQDEQTGGGREDGKQIRFIFDLNLDNMGKVQLDGLFRPRRLDLIVRSEAPLSAAMQMQMRRAYISALEPTEVRGELSFQNKPEQWVTIKPELQKFGTSA